MGGYHEVAEVVDTYVTLCTLPMGTAMASVVSYFVQLVVSMADASARSS